MYVCIYMTTLPNTRRFLYYFEDALKAYAKQASNTSPIFPLVHTQLRLLSVCIHPIDKLVSVFGEGALLRVSVRNFAGEEIGCASAKYVYIYIYIYIINA